MSDAPPPHLPDTDRPTTLGGRVLVELVRLIAILFLVGCAGGLVWIAPLVWDGRPRTWWGWMVLVGGLVFGLARILLGGERPPPGRAERLAEPLSRPSELNQNDDSGVG